MPRVTIKATAYPKRVKINDNRNFRVKFLPGIVSSSSPTNPAPLGVAIIGVNNYIL